MVSPTQLCWRYHSLPLSHRYMLHQASVDYKQLYHAVSKLPQLKPRISNQKNVCRCGFHSWFLIHFTSLSLMFPISWPEDIRVKNFIFTKKNYIYTIYVYIPQHESVSATCLRWPPDRAKYWVLGWSIDIDFQIVGQMHHAYMAPSGLPAEGWSSPLNHSIISVNNPWQAGYFHSQ